MNSVAEQCSKEAINKIMLYSGGQNGGPQEAGPRYSGAAYLNFAFLSNRIFKMLI